MHRNLIPCFYKYVQHVRQFCLQLSDSGKRIINKQQFLHDFTSSLRAAPCILSYNLSYNLPNDRPPDVFCRRYSRCSPVPGIQAAPLLFRLKQKAAHKHSLFRRFSFFPLSILISHTTKRISVLIKKSLYIFRRFLLILTVRHNSKLFSP